MLRGLYLANTGMMTQQERMDVVTNNLANETTSGFKQDQVISQSFAAELISRQNDPAILSRTATIGTMNNGIHLDEVVTSFEQGSLEQTGLATDLALTGDAFFAVATPGGERYTRSGNFKITPDGYLTTQEGFSILGTDGPLQVGREGFSISSTGRVQTPAGTLQLRLVQFDDPQGLRKEGGNLYSNYGAVETQAAEGTAVHQGYLEGSNVDLTTQMSDMIEIYRSHEINQRMIKIMDEKLGKSVSEIGRI